MATFIDSGTQPDDNEEFTMLVTTGISSSVAPLTNHVGMGSREEPFVGDLAMIL